MATKRKITVKVPPPTEGSEWDDRSRPTVIRPDRGWREWLLKDYLRYWYLAGCLLVDAFVFLEVWENIDAGPSLLVLPIMLLALALVELLAYRRLWGKGGRWGNG